jgi:hypothetical protein
VPPTPLTENDIREREMSRALADAATPDEVARNISQIYHDIYERDLTR